MLLFFFGLKNIYDYARDENKRKISRKHTVRVEKQSSFVHFLKKKRKLFAYYTLISFIKLRVLYKEDNCNYSKIQKNSMR